MIEHILDVILSEYGVFVAFLVITIAVLAYTIKILWDRNKYLGDKLIEVTVSSVKVLTILEERIGSGNNNDT